MHFFVLPPLPAWNVDTMSGMEQLSCDHEGKAEVTAENSDLISLVGKTVSPTITYQTFHYKRKLNLILFVTVFWISATHSRI